MVDDATCIPIDEARAETPFSATLGTEANEAVRVKLTATPEGLVVEIGFVGADLPEFARSFGWPAGFGRAVDQGAASDMLEFSNAAVTAPLLTADPKLLKSARALLRHGGEGAHRVGHTAGLGRKRSGKAPAAGQGAKANRGQSARHEHANVLAQAGCRGNDL
jgi:hypothetical protein